MKNKTKVDGVAELMAFLKKSPHFSLIKFEKTSHTSLETLRKELRKNDAQLKVVKNTLLKKALNKIVQEGAHSLVPVSKLMSNLKENTALLSLQGDWSKGLNAFYTFSKKDSSTSFKFGFLDQTVYESSQLTRIAQLPGKSQLMGTILGSLRSPISHITNALKFNQQKLVYILNAKSK